MHELRLKPGRRHRVMQGHPWVFSNQLVGLPPELEPGDPVVVVANDGAFVGRGYGHPNTLISARILEREPDVEIDDAWVTARIQECAQRRRWLAERAGRSAWRLVHGEADGLPGLVVDQFGSRAVLTANTAGMERLRPAIAAAVQELCPEGGLWKCDGRGRELEGLPSVVEPAWGDVESPWSIDDDGLHISFDAMGGQKTGLFLDMWENRRRMVPALARGQVADLYSYVGQWGLHAAAAGAEEVVCVDRSAGAVERVVANAAANDLGDRVQGVVASVDAWLREQPDRSLAGVVCDPPSFIRSKKQVSAGMKAYRTLFAHALRKVEPGGHAVLASCSHHLWEDRFEQVVQEAAKWGKRRLTTLMTGGQAPCHPIPLHVPEARYLKCRLVRVD